MSATWFYKRTEPNLYTVGYGEDRFIETDSDHETKESAAKRVHYLNGGSNIERLEKVNEALVRALELLYLDVLQGADPASKECQERTGSFAKAAEAIRLAKEPV